MGNGKKNWLGGMGERGFTLRKELQRCRMMRRTRPGRVPKLSTATEVSSIWLVTISSMARGAWMIRVIIPTRQGTL
jgi:hypothetical protein